MIEVSPRAVTPELESLFGADMPAGLRCFAVLDGVDAGRIFASDAQPPTWGAVWERNDGTLYLSGRLDTALIAQLVEDLRREGDVLIGLRDGDPLAACLPPNPDYTGAVLEFTNRSGNGLGLDALLAYLPADCELRTMDAALIERSLWREETLRGWGSFETFLQRSRGACLLQGGEILAEASTGPLVHGVREMGVITHEGHRGRGYATLVSACLVRECERHGEATYWNCNAGNAPSAAVARKLGYSTEREYKLWAWFKSDAEDQSEVH
jgi:RimJ/RimL family protein N-acetyltransferase